MQMSGSYFLEIWSYQRLTLTIQQCEQKEHSLCVHIHVWIDVRVGGNVCLTASHLSII